MNEVKEKILYIAKFTREQFELDHIETIVGGEKLYYFKDIRNSCFCWPEDFVKKYMFKY